jgi:uncharacterized iron-regulated membrane protein
MLEYVAGCLALAVYAATTIAHWRRRRHIPASQRANDKTLWRYGSVWAVTGTLVALYQLVEDILQFAQH